MSYKRNANAPRSYVICALPIPFKTDKRQKPNIPKSNIAPESKQNRTTIQTSPQPVRCEATQLQMLEFYPQQASCITECHIDVYLHLSLDVRFDIRFFTFLVDHSRDHSTHLAPQCLLEVTWTKPATIKT
jgi:hypothetical protein